MGKIRDKIWDEAVPPQPPVVSATTLQNCAISFGVDSIIHCPSASDAVRLETLCGDDVRREGQVIQFRRPIMLRVFFDRAFGMCTRRCL